MTKNDYLSQLNMNLNIHWIRKLMRLQKILQRIGQILKSIRDIKFLRENNNIWAGIEKTRKAEGL